MKSGQRMSPFMMNEELVCIQWHDEIKRVCFCDILHHARHDFTLVVCSVSRRSLD